LKGFTLQDKAMSWYSVVKFRGLQPESSSPRKPQISHQENASFKQ